MPRRLPCASVGDAACARLTAWHAAQNSRPHRRGPPARAPGSDSWVRHDTREGRSLARRVGPQGDRSRARAGRRVLGRRVGLRRSWPGRRAPAPPDRSFDEATADAVAVADAADAAPVPDHDDLVPEVAVRGGLREQVAYNAADSLRPGRASSARGGRCRRPPFRQSPSVRRTARRQRGSSTLRVKWAFTAVRSKASGPNVGMTSGASVGALVGALDGALTDPQAATSRTTAPNHTAGRVRCPTVDPRCRSTSGPVD